MAHVLLAFLFLHLPQNDTTPQGVGCHTGLLQIPVYRNCSFYWHHSALDNYNMGRLVNEINITKGCGIKDNFFFVVDIFQVNQFDNNQKGLLFYKNNYALSKI